MMADVYLDGRFIGFVDDGKYFSESIINGMKRLEANEYEILVFDS